MELTLPEANIESLYRLFHDWVVVEAGEIVAPSRPGLGLTIDEQALARYAVATTRTTTATR